MTQSGPPMHSRGKMFHDNGWSTIVLHQDSRRTGDYFDLLDVSARARPFEDINSLSRGRKCQTVAGQDARN
jgi:hypothetical protein